MLALATLLLLSAGATPHLDNAARALDQFDRDRALNELELARKAGPCTYAEHVRLYELAGITHAYLGHDAEARTAFDMLLALDPGHALSYTLSPKVTFVFEQARRESDARATPELRVTWPPGLRVADTFPVNLDVVRDPRGFFSHAVVHYRVAGSTQYERVDVALPPVGQHVHVDLPPQKDAHEPRVIEIFTLISDAAGNQVMQIGTAQRPYAVALAYEPPPPLYKTWWVWAGAGLLAAAAGGVALYVTRDPPARVPAEVRF